MLSRCRIFFCAVLIAFSVSILSAGSAHACKAGYYGIGTSCTQCPNGYQAGDGTQRTQADCEKLIPNRSTIDTKYGTLPSVCPPGRYCVTHRIKYGQVSPITYCPGGTYSKQGAMSCTPCPADYRDGTTTGRTDESQCIMRTSGGYVATAKGPQVPCPAGHSCAAANVAYGSTNTSSPTECRAGYYATGGAISCTQCPEGYRDTTRTGHEAETDCIKETTPGKYVATPGDTTETECPAGYICYRELINYGQSGGQMLCPNGYIDGPAGISAVRNCQMILPPGHWIPGYSEPATPCTAGYYCPGGTVIAYGSSGGRVYCQAGTFCPPQSSAPTVCPVFELGITYTSAIYSTDITDCYIEADQVYQDGKGNGVYTGKCYYTP